MRPLNPFLLPLSSPNLLTAEIENKSIALTQDTLCRLRDVLRQADLPADALPVAASIYHQHLSAELYKAEDAAMRSREAKIRAIEEALENEQPNAPRVRRMASPMSGYVGLAGQPMMGCGDGGLHQMTDEELDAELARVKK